MELTPKLWRFWEGLNRGAIDWRFLDDADYVIKEWTTEERDRAVSMLVDRGFVKDEYMYGKGLWKVTAAGKFINPVHNKRTLYFTARKYAEGYRDYLYGLGKVGEDCSVAEAR